jgi:uncharacterized protein (TIGR02300 family)
MFSWGMRNLSRAGGRLDRPPLKRAVSYHGFPGRSSLPGELPGIRLRAARSRPSLQRGFVAVLPGSFGFDTAMNCDYGDPSFSTRLDVAKPELGTKRIDPETGRKFYDLGKDPIVSPYTGKSYPLSYFETVAAKPIVPEADDEDREVEAEDDGAEIVSLEDAEDDAKGDDLPDIDDEEDVDLGDDEAVFLEEEEEDEDDVAGIINVGDDDEQ